jgi:two-component system nitrogen regulation response regulator GlnG
MDISDIKTQHVDDSLDKQQAAVPMLVIALHPNLNRVGEVAPLLDLDREGRGYVSRNRPEFSKSGYAGKPLADQHISRSPLIIQKDSDELFRVRAHSTSTEVSIPGRSLQQEYLLTADDMHEGVILTLSQKVVLILKFLPLQHMIVPDDNMILGISPDIAAVRDKAKNIARLSLPVMIRGAAGVGKEHVARSIHEYSDQANEPFISVNVAAIHDAVAEEELFGVVRNGQRKRGWLEQAGSGTILLEDLEDASEKVHELIFKAFKAQKVLAVNDANSVALKCRFMLTSTYDNCPENKSSVLWRLNNLLSAYQFFVPNLVDRREDIGLLFYHFVAEQWARVHAEKAMTAEVPTDLVVQLLMFNWPGNVRQLRNVARQIVIDSRDKESLYLDPQLINILANKQESAAQTSSKKVTKSRKPNSVSKDELIESLQNNRFELQATARELNISRASVYQLIQRFDGIQTAQDLDEMTIREHYERYNGDTEKMMWALKVSQVGLRRRLKAMGLAI